LPSEGVKQSETDPVGEPSMRLDKRKERRKQVAQPALMIDDNGSVIGICTMLDVGAGGARLKLLGDVTVPPTFSIFLSKFSQAPQRRCIVAWAKGAEVGIRFESIVKKPAVGN
jgi:hypothetical protein